MSKKVNWWWVVATHVSGKVSPEECDALGMIDFFDHNIAARVFTMNDEAAEWIVGSIHSNIIPEGIELRIINDETWKLVSIMYYRGKCCRV